MNRHSIVRLKSSFKLAQLVGKARTYQCKDGKVSRTALLSCRVLFGAVKHMQCSTDECCFGEEDRVKFGKKERDCIV